MWSTCDSMALQGLPTTAWVLVLVGMHETECLYVQIHACSSFYASSLFGPQSVTADRLTV